MSKQCYHVHRNFSILIFIVHHSQSRWNNKNISSSSVASINENDTQLSMNCSIMTLIVNYHLHLSPLELAFWRNFSHSRTQHNELERIHLIDTLSADFCSSVLVYIRQRGFLLSELTIIRITNYTHTRNTPSGSSRCD